MRLIRKFIEKDGSGSITLHPEEAEDMWHIYNLLAIGDQVRATTVRRVQKETSTGATDSDRVRISLTIVVEKVDFDPQSNNVRLSGKNTSESKYVKMGSYHTLTLEPNKDFTMVKSFWDSVALDRVRAAVDPAERADVAAVIMTEGLANVCLITSEMTLIRARIEVPIPRKRRGTGADAHQKTLDKFFEQIVQAILRHVNFKVIKCIIIASPGFTRDQFLEYMWNETQKRTDELKVLVENRAKFVKAHSSSGHKHSLKEVLNDPEVMPKLADTKALGEVKALQDFYDMLRTDADRAVYGVRHVMTCNERLAIDTLLISDALFRSQNIATRKRYVTLVESVKQNGGNVRIFSSLHVSGEQLGQLGGVAAILRFPILDLDDDSDEEDQTEVIVPAPLDGSAPASTTTTSTSADSHTEVTHKGTTHHHHGGAAKVKSSQIVKEGSAMDSYADDGNEDNDDDLPPPNRNHELNIEDLGLEDDDGDAIDDEDEHAKPEKPIKDK